MIHLHDQIVGVICLWTRLRRSCCIFVPSCNLWGVHSFGALCLDYVNTSYAKIWTWFKKKLCLAWTHHHSHFTQPIIPLCNTQVKTITLHVWRHIHTKIDNYKDNYNNNYISGHNNSDVVCRFKCLRWILIGYTFFCLSFSETVFFKNWFQWYPSSVLLML